MATRVDMPTPPRILAAAAFDDDALARLFTEGYSGYSVPVRLEAAAFRAMVDTQDLDLAASRVLVRQDVPVAFALLGVRGRRGWIGGMGVVPGARGRGDGRRVMDAALASARAASLERVDLEVLVENEPASRIYEAMGFVDTRRLEVWVRDPGGVTPRGPGSGAAEGSAGHRRDRVEPAALDDWLAARDGFATAPPPWQRATPVLRRVVELQVLIQRDRGAAAAGIVFRLGPTGCQILDLAARPDAAADALGMVLAASLDRAAGLAVRLLNLPAGDPAAPVLAAFGFTVAHRQREMTISP